MSGNNSNSTKYKPVPLSALMADLVPLHSYMYSLDSSYNSAPSDDNLCIEKSVSSNEKKQNDSEKSNNEMYTSVNKNVLSDNNNDNTNDNKKNTNNNKKENTSEIKKENTNNNKKENTNDNKKENTNDNKKENTNELLYSGQTYPNKESYNQNREIKKTVLNQYPGSEVKKQSVLIPHNFNVRHIQRPIPDRASTKSSSKLTVKSTPEISKLQHLSKATKKTPENAIVPNSLKHKISTPVLKSGIRKYTPGSSHKSQKKIQKKITDENKESVRCLFPENPPQHKGSYSSAPVPETPLNKNIAPPAATPSYPQSVVGNDSKLLFKKMNIKNKQYMFLKQLGTGGSSVVYKVLEVGTSCEYAVKCVDLSTDQELAQGYINEVRLLRQLQNSDRVIRLCDYEYDGKKRILRVVMEAGETDLSSFLKARGAGLPPALVLHYWEEMLLAVNFIHEKGVIHADLKPANFLLVCGRLKLIDFGIASAISSDATSVVRSQATGTYSYISPEALGGASSHQGSSAIKISFKSDVWSLGCILYSMVYGRTPFHHIPNLAKLAAILNPNHRIDYPPVEHLPSSLIAALKWCLTYNPPGRPTVQQLLAIPYMQAQSSHLPQALLEKLQPYVTPREFQLLQKAKIEF